MSSIHISFYYVGFIDLVYSRSVWRKKTQCHSRVNMIRRIDSLSPKNRSDFKYRSSFLQIGNLIQVFIQHKHIVLPILSFCYYFENQERIKSKQIKLQLFNWIELNSFFFGIVIIWGISLANPISILINQTNTHKHTHTHAYTSQMPKNKKKEYNGKQDRNTTNMQYNLVI